MVQETKTQSAKETINAVLGKIGPMGMFAKAFVATLSDEAAERLLGDLNEATAAYGRGDVEAALKVADRYGVRSQIAGIVMHAHEANAKK